MSNRLRPPQAYGPPEHSRPFPPGALPEVRPPLVTAKRRHRPPGSPSSCHVPSLRSGVAPPVTVGGENALGHHDSCERNGLTPFQALLRPLRGDEKQGRAGHPPFVQTYGSRRTPAGPGKRSLRPATRGRFSPGGFFSFVSAGALQKLASLIRRKENGGSIVVSARFSQKRRVSSAMAPTRCSPTNSRPSKFYLYNFI